MNKKQIIFTAAKIVFAIAMLWWLFHKMNVGRVWGHVRDAERGPILAGLVLCWFTIVIAGLRWHRLLAAFGVSIPRRALICIVQIGQFFLMFLPGPAGDDLTRILYISRLSGEGNVATTGTTVLLDRCIGLASILIMAVVCIPMQWTLLAGMRETHLIALGLSTAGGVIVAGVLLFFAVNGSWMQRMVGNLLRLLPASGLREEFFRISERIFTSKDAIAKVLLAALGTQFVLCMVFALAGRSVGIHVPVSVWFGFVPIVLAANALPITVAGIGVRESLMVLFLGVLAHVESEQALAASFVALGITLAVCLLGGVVYIFYRPKKKTEGAVLVTPLP